MNTSPQTASPSAVHPGPGHPQRRRWLGLGLGLGVLGAWGLMGCSTTTGRGLAPPASPLGRFAVTVDTQRVVSPPGWPQTLHADIYRPQVNTPQPAVLLIHGGGWAPPDRRHQMVSIAQRLAQRGYVVVNTTYRLAPEHLHPAPVQDLRQVLAWMRQHHAELGLKPDRIAAFGYSAGGHLAALLGAQPAPAHQQVQAVVAGGAPTELSKWSNGKLVVRYLGGTPTEVPQQYADASPIRHVTAAHPPTFLYHGKWDTLVTVDHSTDYQAALDRAGVPNEMVLSGGKGHITAFVFDGAAIEAAISFLDRTLR